jgi:hypothetical protein
MGGRSEESHEFSNEVGENLTGKRKMQITSKEEQ